MHPNNKYQGSYDFGELAQSTPELSDHLVLNPRGQQTITFSNPASVKLLNQALLKSYYNINYWEIPEGYLVPPIPSRSDYIHHIAELVSQQDQVRMLDIGTGANLIYPIVAVSAYRWSVVGSDIDTVALSNAQTIIDQNDIFQGKCELIHQSNRQHILKGLLSPNDHFDIIVCNPPFHASAEQAHKVASRKRRNLKYQKGKNTLNFGGQSNELWCPGGEIQFIKTMIHETKDHASQCGWCTTLVSSHRLLESLEQLLMKLNASEIRIIDMQHGNKSSQLLCWRFR